MQDNINALPDGEQAEPDPAGEIRRPAKFGIGARATILMGLTMGVVAVASAIPTMTSTVVSKN